MAEKRRLRHCPKPKRRDDKKEDQNDKIFQHIIFYRQSQVQIKILTKKI